MDTSLFDRMENSYENITRYYLPRRTFSIIRLDGNNWSNYTKNLNKPFDLDLVEDLNNSVINLMGRLQGAKFAYIQSDEVSILLTDFDNINSEPWFGGNIQKMASVSSSILTATFNQIRYDRFIENPQYGGSGFNLGFFDSRVFTIPDRTEVFNYFYSRFKDCTRNAISQVASSLYSHKELHNRNTAQKEQLIYDKGVEWNKYREDLKFGRLVIKKEIIDSIVVWSEETKNPEVKKKFNWITKPAPDFRQNKKKLFNLIPNYS